MKRRPKYWRMRRMKGSEKDKEKQRRPSKKGRIKRENVNKTKHEKIKEKQ